VPIEFKQV